MNLRALASGLLTFTAFAHVLEHLLRSHAPGMLIAGIVYGVLGTWLRWWPGKLALIVCAILPALGGLGGTQQLLAAPAIDPILAGMVAIDAVVVACCVVCLVRGAAGAPAKP
jgi:hypothetical protein